MSTTTGAKEGFIDFTYEGETYQTWFLIHGDLKGGDVPLIALHGGPGCSHHYMLSLVDLVTPKRAVVFYDQIGGGASTHLKDKPKEFWKPELFMAELANVISKLGVADQYDLLGHSWGGMLGAQFASTFEGPEIGGLRKLIISDSPASMTGWGEACAELIKGLPEDVQATLKKHEDAGTTDSPEYQGAVQVFYAKHLCRVQPMPEPVQKTFALMEEDPTVYNAMNGPSEFHIIGSLKTWDIIPQLHRISVPTLLLNGRHDEAQDSSVMPYFQFIPRVKWYTFAEGSHMPHWEEREQYMKIVSSFLSTK